MVQDSYKRDMNNPSSSGSDSSNSAPVSPLHPQSCPFSQCTATLKRINFAAPIATRNEVLWVALGLWPATSGNGGGLPLLCICKIWKKAKVWMSLSPLPRGQRTEFLRVSCRHAHSSFKHIQMNRLCWLKGALLSVLDKNWFECGGTRLWAHYEVNKCHCLHLDSLAQLGWL